MGKTQDLGSGINIPDPQHCESMSIGSNLFLNLLIVGSEIQGEKPAVLWIRDVYPGSRFLLIPNPGSRIPDLGSRISDPGSRIPDLGSRISDPGCKNSNKREGWKKFCHTFLYSLKCHKIEHYFSFQELKKKTCANFQRIIELFT